MRPRAAGAPLLLLAQAAHAAQKAIGLADCPVLVQINTLSAVGVPT